MEKKARPLSREERWILSRAGYAPAWYECLSNVNNVLTVRHKGGSVIRQFDMRTWKEKAAKDSAGGCSQSRHTEYNTGGAE